MTKLIHLSFASALLCLMGVFAVHDASALTYQTSEDVSFTFNPSIAINLSSDLVINNLTPGSAADSNIITVSASTNNTTGYVLTASVGNTTNATTNLINGSYNFASVATNASLASLATDNTWGYSFSEDDGSTWTNYSGLPLYTSANWKEIITTNSQGTTNLKFKIGAKASTSQASGTYTNVINFTAVANATPLSINDAFAAAGKTKLNGYYKMQDMNSTICSNVELTGESSQTKLIDSRDNKVYWVAKLADDNCWMTQNLDHDIVTTPNFYTYANTDIGHGSTPNTSATWTADKATYTTGVTTWDTTSTGNYIQQSYDPGNKIWDEVVYSWNDAPTLDTMDQGTNTHYHIGNYYSWSAAVAMNDTSSYTANNTDVNQSICPAGWMLPKAMETTSSPASLRYLADQYNYNVSSEIMNDPYIWEPPLYFSLSGEYRGGGNSNIYVANWSSAWTSVTERDLNAYNLDAGQNTAYIPGSGSRQEGVAVRCVAR